MKHPKFTEVEALRKSIKAIIENATMDEDGDYYLDFVGNKSGILWLNQKEYNNLLELAQAYKIKVTLTSYF